MKEYIPIITAVIALIGTIIGLVIGYRKWKKEQHSQKFGQFDKEKQEAYKELWNRVEDFNIKIRIEDVNPRAFTDHLQKLNAFILKQGLYIEDDDKKLANDYSNAVFNFQNVVKNANINEANIRLGETRDIPEDVIRKAKEIGDAQKKALKLRDELINKIRMLLSGKEK